MVDASLIAWLDHLGQKTKVRGKQEHAPIKNFAPTNSMTRKKKKQMAPSTQQL